MPTTNREWQYHHEAIRGGAQLHLVEAGKPTGQAVVFLHGLSQSWLSWLRQLDSGLTDRFRLVALDLRGHGRSDKPTDGYDSKAWADDIAALIQQLGLERPILCGWSYGPLIMLDYIRHYNEHALGGIHFVCGITKLGSDAALSALTPEFLALVPGLLSTDAESSTRALDELLSLCFETARSDRDRYAMLGSSSVVPPFVRQALFSRLLDNDDLLATVRLPLLVTMGERDRIVRQSVADHIRRVHPKARVTIIRGAGHAPFWDDPPSFNRIVAEFCEVVRALPSRLHQATSV